jgi:hypothetical protein
MGSLGEGGEVRDRHAVGGDDPDPVPDVSVIPVAEIDRPGIPIERLLARGGSRPRAHAQAERRPEPA